MKIGLLTGGGDCPGLNAVIRAIVRKGIDMYRDKFVGIRNGWAGLLDINVIKMDIHAISGILHKGGTILGTSRTNPAKSEENMKKVIRNYKRLRLNALIAIGGDDTLGVAYKIYERGVPIIGVPKTIDNDIFATDMTFGFDTAVSIATEAIDRLHTTAESHHRVMIVEVMGRHAGWIATYAGIAGGADVILIPEEPFEIDEICRLIKRRVKRGKTFSLIVVAEGAKAKQQNGVVVRSKEKDQFGNERLGGIGESIAKQIEEKTGIETRTTILGHVQRGGTPTAFDRILGTRYGVKAIDLVHLGKFGRMVSLRGDKITDVALKDAVSRNRLVEKEIFEVAKVFFG